MTISHNSAIRPCSKASRRTVVRCGAAIVALWAFLFIDPVWSADLGLPALTMKTGADGEQTYTLSIQILLLMTALTLLPGALVIMTSFTRIVIVLAILRQALGLNQTPSNQVLIGLALFLTLFVMAPVFEKLYVEAVEPYLKQEATQKQALSRAGKPMREFMLAQTRASDLNLFVTLKGDDTIKDIDKVPFSVLIPAFITSELKTAFQIGFLLFIPFLIIDLVVASVLMAMGMMMLSPMMISLPFKIMLFVLVDGWTLTIGALASSFLI